jgi:hypothetical protein
MLRHLLAHSISPKGRRIIPSILCGSSHASSRYQVQLVISNFLNVHVFLSFFRFSTSSYREYPGVFL